MITTDKTRDKSGLFTIMSSTKDYGNSESHRKITEGQSSSEENDAECVVGLGECPLRASSAVQTYNPSTQILCLIRQIEISDQKRPERVVWHYINEKQHPSSLRRGKCHHQKNITAGESCHIYHIYLILHHRITTYFGRYKILLMIKISIL